MTINYLRDALEHANRIAERFNLEINPSEVYQEAFHFNLEDDDEESSIGYAINDVLVARLEDSFYQKDRSTKEIEEFHTRLEDVTY